MLTFKKMEELRSVASRLPLDRILCETDAPWLSPHPLRGRRNEPSHVRYVYQVLSECRKEDSNTVEEQVWMNAASLFGWE
jgi:TatD DNase family protein